MPITLSWGLVSWHAGASWYGHCKHSHLPSKCCWELMIVPVDRMLRLLFISSRIASLAVEISAIDRNRRCVDKQYAGRLAVAVETVRSEFEVSGRTMSSSELSFLARHMNSENDSRTCLVALPASAAPPAVRLVNKLRPLYPPPLSRPFLHHPPTHPHTQTHRDSTISTTTTINPPP